MDDSLTNALANALAHINQNALTNALAQVNQNTLSNAFAHFNQNTLWASCLWGALAAGYFVYGRKQKSFIPWLGGFAMTAACFMSSVLWMSLICIAAMFVVWWLLRQGY